MPVCQADGAPYDLGRCPKFRFQNGVTGCQAERKLSPGRATRMVSHTILTSFATSDCEQLTA
jgi:hypothetical protein